MLLAIIGSWRQQQVVFIIWRCRQHGWMSKKFVKTVASAFERMLYERLAFSRVGMDHSVLHKRQTSFQHSILPRYQGCAPFSYVSKGYYYLAWRERMGDFYLMENGQCLSLQPHQQLQQRRAVTKIFEIHKECRASWEKRDLGGRGELFIWHERGISHSHVFHMKCTMKMWPQSNFPLAHLWSLSNFRRCSLCVAESTTTHADA